MSADSAYIASFVRQIAGPMLPVGHSYGGAVITNAGASVPNVVGLVYIAAFAPDEGESLLSIEGHSRDSVLSSALLQYPAGRSRDPEQKPAATLGASERSLDVRGWPGSVIDIDGGQQLIAR